MLTWYSPGVHLTFTWPPDHHLTFPWPLPSLNPFVAVSWFINHYFFVKFFFLEEKIIPKIFQTFGWCIYPVSVTLWAPWLGDFDNLNLFYRKIKIEKMPKFETLFATRGLNMYVTNFRLRDVILPGAWMVGLKKMVPTCRAVGKGVQSLSPPFFEEFYLLSYVLTSFYSTLPPIGSKSYESAL